MTDDELDELLYRCMPTISGAIIGELEAESALLPPHSFSRRYKRKKRAIIKKAEEASFGAPLTVTAHRFRLRRAVLVAVAAVITMSVTAFAAVPQLRNVVWQIFQQYTSVYFEGADSAAEEAAFTIYEPVYIPNDYKKLNEEAHKKTKSHLAVYENNLGDKIIFKQLSLEYANIQLNTEDTELLPIEINGNKAYYFSNLGTQSVFWYDDKYSYLVSSVLDEKEVIKIANSLKLKK